MKRKVDEEEEKEKWRWKMILFLYHKSPFISQIMNIIFD